MPSLLGPCVRVKWYESTEDVPVFPHQPLQKPFTTVEYWGRPREWLPYRPKVKVSRKGSVVTYELVYSKLDHPEIKLATVEWGQTTITIDEATDEVTAFWQPESGKESFQPAILVNQQTRSRTIARPTLRNQSPLRGLLLAIDGQCALTGEKTPAALECAHVISVGSMGMEYASNAVLLRADLHCLLDNGDFDISPSGKVVRVSSLLSDTYRGLLVGAKLTEAVKERVHKALKERAQK